MKEEDIRSEQLMRENAALHAEDVRKLMLQKKDFIEVPCPACESENYQTIFEKNGFNFVTCRECGTVFINPRPTFKMLSEFYATSSSIKHWNDEIFPASEDARRSQIFAPRAKRVAELCQTHGAKKQVLLDVGAGFGTFCEEIKKLSIFDRIIAVEPSLDMAATCQRKGIEVIAKPIEEVEMDEVSVITNFELIEHLYWPKNFLLACGKALPTGGMLIITTPNVKGFDLMMLGKLSANMSGPNHLNYFHPQSLEILLNHTGFEILEALTPGKLDAELVRKKILSGELDISNSPFIKQVLVDRWDTVGKAFQQFLSGHELSSHLWVVARKV